MIKYAFVRAVRKFTLFLSKNFITRLKYSVYFCGSRAIFILMPISNLSYKRFEYFKLDDLELKHSLNVALN